MVATTSGRSLKTAKAVLVVLSKLSEATEGLTTDQVAAITGKSTATATYLLNSLVIEGFAHRIGPGRYCISDQSKVAVNESPARPADIMSAAAQELYRRIGERVYTGIPDGDSVVLNDTWGRQGQPLVPGIGQQIGGAAHALAIGKTLLANIGPERVKAYIDRYGLKQFTPKTITCPAVLGDELSQIAQSGVAVDNQEFATGFAGLASPVFSEKPELVGVVAISVSQVKMMDHHRMLIPALTRIAQQASSRTGRALSQRGENSPAAPYRLPYRLRNST